MPRPVHAFPQRRQRLFEVGAALRRREDGVVEVAFATGYGASISSGSTRSARTAAPALLPAPAGPPPRLPLAWSRRRSRHRRRTPRLLLPPPARRGRPTRSSSVAGWRARPRASRCASPRTSCSAPAEWERARRLRRGTAGSAPPAQPGLVAELERYAAEGGLAFDPERARAFQAQADRAVRDVVAHSAVRFERVPASPDGSPTRAGGGDVLRGRLPRRGRARGVRVRGGAEWHRSSGCCEPNAGTLRPKPWWPPYVHLRGQLEDAVHWLRIGNVSNAATLDAMRALLPPTPPSSTPVSTTRRTGTKATASGSRAADGRQVRARAAVFASGGLGGAMSAAAAAELRIHSPQSVHASGNDGVLWRTAEKRGGRGIPWCGTSSSSTAPPSGSCGAATVLEEEGPARFRLVYDESASYDERGRLRRAANASTWSWYASRDSASESTLPEGMADAVQRSGPAKSCDSRSKRMWRNFLTTYGVGAAVGKARAAAASPGASACASRASSRASSTPTAGRAPTPATACAISPACSPPATPRARASSMHTSPRGRRSATRWSRDTRRGRRRPDTCASSTAGEVGRGRVRTPSCTCLQGELARRSFVS